MKTKTNSLTLLTILIAAVFIARIGVKSENRIVKKCENVQNTRDCRLKEVVKVMNERGVRFAFIAVENLKDADSEFGPTCHAFVHEIGLEAYKNVLKGSKFLAVPISPCNYAFFHGLMMELVMHQRTTKELDFRFANQVCQDVVRMSGYDQSIKYQCYHGIGHGLAPYHLLMTNKPIAEIIDNSLRDCEEYFDAKDFCKTGVYGGMSLFITGDHNLFLEGFGISDAFKLCKNQPLDLRPVCYEMIAPALVFSTGGDVKKAVAVMKDSIKNDEERLVISRQLGQAVLSYNFEAGIVEMKEVCDQILGDSHLSCVEGFINGYFDSRSKNSIKQTAESFCQSPSFTNEESDLCRNLAVKI